MSNGEYGYLEHQILEVEGFRVVDATATGPRAHDDLVWVGFGGVEGSWLTPNCNDSRFKPGRLAISGFSDSNYLQMTAWSDSHPLQMNLQS